MEGLKEDRKLLTMESELYKMLKCELTMTVKLVVKIRKRKHLHLQSTF